MIRPLVRKLIPFPIRLYFKVMQVQLLDRISGDQKKMAVQFHEKKVHQHVLEIVQPLRLTATNQEKKHNLQIAIDRINLYMLQPGAIFSFWHVLGKPTVAKGYRKSRVIQDGKIIQETGGGLCQLSGMLYFLALQTGMQIIERHAHSLDIYTEAERFTPLGSDATVVYGYKDLRFCNTTPTPLQICFELIDDCIIGRFYSESPIENLTIRFDQEKSETGIWVSTIVENKSPQALIQRNFYRTI